MSMAIIDGTYLSISKTRRSSLSMTREASGHCNQGSVTPSNNFYSVRGNNRSTPFRTRPSRKNKPSITRVGGGLVFLIVFSEFGRLVLNLPRQKRTSRVEIKAKRLKAGMPLFL